MAFWEYGLNLDEALKKLPEPVMVVGNKAPDGDSLGCSVAVLDFLRQEGKEAYIHCVIPPSVDLAWMLEEGDTNPKIMEEYASLVVVDDAVNERLGFIPKDVPTINVDHHMSNKPTKQFDAFAKGPIIQQIRGNVLQYWKEAPATAVPLIDEFIGHPYLWVSLYTDTVGFTVNGATGASYVACLDIVLKDQEDDRWPDGLTDAMQEDMQQKLSITSSLSSLNSLLTGRVYTFTGDFHGKPFQIVCGILDIIPEDDANFRNILQAMNIFADVVCLINENTAKGSLRSRTYDFNVREIAQRYGGGGHERAAGFSLQKDRLLEQYEEIQDILLSRLTNVRSKLYL